MLSKSSGKNIYHYPLLDLKSLNTNLTSVRTSTSKLKVDKRLDLTTRLSVFLERTVYITLSILQCMSEIVGKINIIKKKIEQPAVLQEKWLREWIEI